MITLEDIGAKLSEAMVQLQELKDQLTAQLGKNLCDGICIRISEAAEGVEELQRATDHEHEWVNVSTPGDVAKLEKCRCGAERKSDASDAAEVGA